LREAQERRERRLEEERERLEEELCPESSAEAVDECISGILNLLVGRQEVAWAVELMGRFEERARAADALHHLPSILRFWKGVKNRDPSARRRAREIEAEIQERERLAQARGEVRDLIREIRSGIEYLDQLGQHERSAQMHVWLGKLRRFQDEFEFDSPTQREIAHTFGAINSARKRLEVPGYIDALNRNFNTNWETYVKHWEERLPEARRLDREDRETEQRLERRRREEEETKERERREAAERLAMVIEDLRALPAPAPEGRTELDTEEVRSLLREGVRRGGNSVQEFLEAASPFSRLGYGSEFRSLRRSLRKIGVPEKELPSAPPAEPDDRFDRLLAERRGAWRGKRVAIVGGLPQEGTRRRVEEGLGLAELRWYELYREHDSYQDVARSVRSGRLDALVLLIRYASHRIAELREIAKGEGVPCGIVDRGCGVAALLRGLDACARRDGNGTGADEGA
jgi:hypothetical protein